MKHSELESVPVAESTGSQTIADLLSLAAERFTYRVALKYKDGDAWVEVRYGQVERIVRGIALGLMDLGLEKGDRAAILCATRPDWTYVDFAISMAGGVVVPIYPSNSPDECEWVLRDSGAKLVVCENAAQVEKIAAVRERLPDLQAIIVIDSDPSCRDLLSL